MKYRPEPIEAAFQFIEKHFPHCQRTGGQVPVSILCF